ncbi:methylated-DNA--[protein]-cysteine S-methyltransferase [Streptomyces smyrnaeus]|uniref:methylated-DNA--[protein]-cysteine S-methyltransferase n=1 Tax=Streptomyces TaxID=1883 RepID=UPI000C187F6A|nr:MULTISPECIES: methylated-DNA--[protein]-cysteine S-methyltransferase [unclassified Streptomyces]MBQ0864960.1 methylated-DNA--[protein]-cysteine S-methyltransferase [Streptomyces sp. RK75]MBQ1124809.1 methylated-DNA--[protein]-cysteine S-methyltransferase [Streptomyces sp. B15]MBQ1158787.1 methylated-DNA--[protein]-cysteine S-methyltransferase [Streptomyces sp. A73]
MTDTPVRPTAWTLRETPIGPLLLAATEKGLVNVVFHARGRTLDRALSQLSARLGSEPLPAEHPDAPSGHLAATGAALDRYFAGSPVSVDVPLDWSLTGGFNERVLRELAAHVPYGTTVGYQDLALRVGDPGAARAVGVAMGANPLPVVVPCHRVLESSGAIGGFGGGLETKRALLALEGLLPQPLF